MKKISLIILLLAVVAGLVGPHFAGNSFNQQLDEFAAKISEQPFYEASIESREQSWFSTTASLVISLDGAAFGPQADDVEQPKLSLTIPIEAQHGPLLTQSGLGLGWIDWQVNIAIDDPEARFALPEGEEYIYSATGIVNLFGTVSYQDVMPAFTYTHPELALTVAISGWQGNASLTSDSIDSATEEAMSVALSFQSTQIATIENISIVTDLEAGLMQAWKNSLYDGVASFTIDGMTIANPTTGEETKLKNIVMDSVTSVDQTAGLGDVLVSTKVASFVNSTVAMQDIQFDLEMANLQGSFLKAYSKMTEDIMNSPDEADGVMQAFLKDAGLAQLQVDPEFNLPVLKGVINESKFDGYANTKVVGIQALPDTMEDARFWAEHAVVDAKLSIEDSAAVFITELILRSQLAANPQFAVMTDEEQKALIEQQTQGTINAFVQQGILSETEEGYEITFTMENAEALLNGQPMGLPF